MAGTGLGSLRVKLDLSDFVLDGGSHRWMLLPAERFRTVSDLAAQLREEYGELGAEDVVQVMLEGFLVPAWEPIELLQSGDTVKVIRTKKSHKKRKGSPEAGAGAGLAAGVNKRPKRPSNQEDSSTDSSSGADSANDIPVVKSNDIPHKKKSSPEKPQPTMKKSGSSSSSDSESSSDDNCKSSKVNTAGIAAAPTAQSTPLAGKGSRANASSSSSSSDSSSEEEAAPAPVPTPTPAPAPAPAPAPEVRKPGRKRKRKNKNKNALPAEQLPVVFPFPPSAPPLAPAPAPPAGNNSHVRFDRETEAMETDQQRDRAAAEQTNQVRSKVSSSSSSSSSSEEESVAGAEFTAEEVRRLYSQAVSSGAAGVGQQTVSNRAPAPATSKCAPAPGQKLGGTTISCEDILLSRANPAHSNTATVKKSQSRIVFKPRALTVKELNVGTEKRGLPVEALKSGAGEGQEIAGEGEADGGAPPLQQFSQLLACRDAQYEAGTRDYTSLLPATVDIVKPGVTLAFKLFELGEDYTPGVSDYKEATVVQCEGETVTLEMLIGSRRRPGGKFELDPEGADEEKVRSFAWSQLIEPKLV